MAKGRKPSVRYYATKGDAAFPGRGRPSPGDEEVIRLRAERDLLEKAAAYFASPLS